MVAKGADVRLALIAALWLLIGVGPFVLYWRVPRTRRVLAAAWRGWIILATWLLVPLGLIVWWYEPGIIWPHNRWAGYLIAAWLTFSWLLLARSEVRWLDERFLKPKHKMQPRVWRLGSQIQFTRVMSGWYIRLWRWRVDTTEADQ